MINSKVAKETIVDVGIGLIISFPIAFTVLTFARQTWSSQWVQLP